MTDQVRRLDAEPAPGTPRWVTAFAAIAVMLAVFVLFVLLSGGAVHGPARRMPRDTGGHSRVELLLLLGLLVIAAVALNWSRLAASGLALPRLPRHTERRNILPLATPRLRKFLLTAHVVCSVGSLGAVAAFLVLAIVGFASTDTATLSATYPAMDRITRSLIVPLVGASLLTGVISSLGTPWGLLRHYWVLAKLLLTVFTFAVLLMQLGAIGHIASAAIDSTLSGPDLQALRLSLSTHAAGGLLLLGTAVTFAVYKPAGLTPRGARMSRE